MNQVQPIVVHISQGTGWWATVLTGFVGAVLGVIGAFVVAWYVVRRGMRASVSERRAKAAELGLKVMSAISVDLFAALGSGFGEVRYTEAHKHATSRMGELTALVGGLSPNVDTQLVTLMDAIRAGNYTPEEEMRLVWALRERTVAALKALVDLTRSARDIMLDAV